MHNPTSAQASVLAPGMHLPEGPPSRGQPSAQTVPLSARRGFTTWATPNPFRSPDFTRSTAGASCNLLGPPWRSSASLRITQGQSSKPSREDSRMILFVPVPLIRHGVAADELVIAGGVHDRSEQSVGLRHGRRADARIEEIRAPHPHRRLSDVADRELGDRRRDLLPKRDLVALEESTSSTSPSRTRCRYGSTHSSSPRRSRASGSANWPACGEGMSTWRRGPSPFVDHRPSYATAAW